MQENELLTKDTSEIYKKLIEPFKNEAYSVDSSRYNPETGKGFKLTSIKAQYIKERLNEVFGIFGWKIEGEHIHGDTGVLYKGTLSLTIGWKIEGDDIRKITHEIPSIGFARIMKNLGDAYKSAMTDCLSKAASNIGIGNEVFKGNIDPSTIGGNGIQAKNNNNSKTANKNNVKDPIKEVPNHEWVIPFGKKFKGKRFADCILEDLDSYANFLVNSAKDSGKELQGPAKEFVDRVDYEMQAK